MGLYEPGTEYYVYADGSVTEKLLDGLSYVFTYCAKEPDKSRASRKCTGKIITVQINSRATYEHIKSAARGCDISDKIKEEILAQLEKEDPLSLSFKVELGCQ